MNFPKVNKEKKDVCESDLLRQCRKKWAGEEERGPRVRRREQAWPPHGVKSHRVSLGLSLAGEIERQCCDISELSHPGALISLGLVGGEGQNCASILSFPLTETPGSWQLGM